MIQLHDHQVEAVTAIEKEFAAERRRTLAVLATGTGKTIIYLSLVDKWAREGKRVLILAHRRELIHQPVERATEFYPKLAKRMGIVMANLDESKAQVIVATIQTASRGRLADQTFDYIVLDEAHHGTAATYVKMFERFPTAKWLGLTATPFRRDGDPLAKVFDSVAYRFPINAAIERGMLVPFDAYGFTLPISVEGVEETEEGWADEAMGSLLSAGNVLDIVYEKWYEYCLDRQTIIFTASVAQAYTTAGYFNKMDVAAAAVSGTTPKKERDDILKRFRNKELQVVVNCQVWTEGVDVPEASAALMVCPTKSDLAYVQKLGRVLRTFPGKTNAVILDFAPIEDRNIIMAGDILGVPKILEKAEKKATKAGIMIRATRVDDHGLPASVDPAVIVIEALQYLRQGLLAWSLVDYTAVASVSDSVSLVIELPNVVRIAKAEELRATKAWDDRKERLYKSLLQYRLWICKKVDNSWTAVLSGFYEDMEKAVECGSSLVEKVYQPGLAKRKRAWRNRPVSPAQVSYMARLRIQIPDPCSQGQAAQLITHAIACNAINKARPGAETQIMEG